MKTRYNFFKWLMIGASSCVVLFIAGCKDDAGPAEKAGREVDKVMDQLNEGMKDLTN